MPKAVNRTGTPRSRAVTLVDNLQEHIAPVPREDVVLALVPPSLYLLLPVCGC